MNIASAHSSFTIHHSKFRRGFTLLEILLAVALTAIIAAILGASIYTAFRAKTSIDNAIEATRETDTAGDMLDQELSFALAPTPTNATSTVLNLFGSSDSANQTLIGPFEGDTNSLDFFSSGPEPKADLQPDVREIQYLLVADPASVAGAGSQLLVRRVVTNLLEDQYVQPPDEVVARNVVQFSLSYSDGNSWYDTWDSTLQNNQLPLAVQFTLALAPKPGNQKSRVDSRTLLLPCCTQPASAAASSSMGGATP